jgi:hypothetical protein
MGEAMTDKGRMEDLDPEPRTEELLEELLASEKTTQYLNSHVFSERSFSDYLSEMIESKGLKRADVFRKADIGYTYGYQLVEGIRGNPSRDFVLRFAFGMALNIRECDRLLQAADKSRLYPKNRRDAIIMFCLERHTTLMEVNDELYARGERTLTDED